MLRVLKCILSLAFFVSLSGCAEQLFFPRFDGGLLNPDIRFLRASDVVSGMKCAFVAFMQEREEQLIRERLADPSRYGKIETTTASGGPLEIDDSIGPIKTTSSGKVPTKAPVVYDPYATNRTWQAQCGLGEHFVVCDDTDKNAASGEERKEKDRKCRQPDQVKKYKFRSGVCVTSRSCSPLSARFWDYAPTSVKDRGQVPVYKGCRPVPDYSRFALDPTQNAKIQLTLMGTNSGFANYSKIDITKMGSFINFVVPGGGTRGDPFPGLRIDGNGATTFDLSVNIPQSLVTPRQPDPYPSGGQFYAGRMQAAQVEALRQKTASLYKDFLLDHEKAEKVKNFGAQNMLALQMENTPAANIDTAVGAALAISTNLFETERISQNLFEAIDPSRRDETLNKLGDVMARARQAAEAQVVRPLNAKGVQGPPGTVALLREWTIAFADTAQAIADKDLRAATKATGALRRATADLETLSKLQEHLQSLTSAAGTEEGPRLEIKGVDPTEEISVIEDRARTINDEHVRSALSAGLKTVAAKVADVQAETIERQADVESTRGQPPARATRSPQAEAALSEVDDQKWFDDYCTAGRLSSDHENVDYLALKRLLHTVVEEQNETLYRGSPPVTMDSLVLTSKFQITLDATAGTHGIFRILPLLAAPNMDLKADHVHTLKITLAGGRKKGDPNVKYQLSCEERLQKRAPSPGSAPDDGFNDGGCGSTGAQLLESILETLESNQAATAGTQ